MTSFSLILILTFAHPRPAPKPMPSQRLYGRVDEWGYVYLRPTQAQADYEADRSWFTITNSRGDVIARPR
jgi:hypothetical protein